MGKPKVLCFRLGSPVLFDDRRFLVECGEKQDIQFGAAELRG